MTVRIACVVFDCLDALVAGRFWSAATGRPLDPEGPSEFASIGFNAPPEGAVYRPSPLGPLPEAPSRSVVSTPVSGISFSRLPHALRSA
jgi:hypothetical protein